MNTPRNTWHQAFGAATLLVLAGALALPAAAAEEAGCGRISTKDLAPRQQDLHGATVISIDGKLPGPRNADSWRVTPGTHMLEVAERIDGAYVSFNNRQRNAAPQYKKLSIDVPADTTLLIAAKLNREHRNEWQNAAYWEPVVWKQTAEKCR